MREIKFRYIVTEPAKNITHRLYHTLEGIEQLDPNHQIFKPSYKIVSRDLYTGLKDKNGVEIYEGDVVNVNKPWIKPRIEVVKFYTVGGMAGVHPFTDTEHQWTSYTAEVIGNIYEHPHLLEVGE